MLGMANVWRMVTDLLAFYVVTTSYTNGTGRCPTDRIHGHDDAGDGRGRGRAVRLAERSLAGCSPLATSQLAEVKSMYHFPFSCSASASATSTFVTFYLCYGALYIYIYFGDRGYCVLCGVV